MLQILTLLIILAVVLIIGRLATIALTVTGIPREIAKFQARSALTGAGFTTNESESLVNHPARRRIIVFLMTVGAIGGAAGIATTISAFVGVSGFGDGLERGFFLLGGLFVLVVLSRTKYFDKIMSRAFAGIVKRITDVDLTDYGSLLRLSGEYGVAEVHVKEGEWLAGRTLAEMDLSHEGVLVLGVVHPNHTYIGAPKGDTRVRVNDTLILYGRAPLLAELDVRKAGLSGERAHKEAVATQRGIEDAERRSDEGTEGEEAV